MGQFIDEFTTTHTVVRPGDVVTLAWKTHGAEVIELSPYGVVEPNGTKTIPYEELPINVFYLTARTGKQMDTRFVAVNRMYGALGGRVVSANGVPISTKVHTRSGTTVATDATGSFRFPSMQIPMEVGVTHPQQFLPQWSTFFHNVTNLDGEYVVPWDPEQTAPHADFDLTIDHSARPLPSDHWRIVLTMVVAGGRVIGRSSNPLPGNGLSSWDRVNAVMGGTDPVDTEVITFEADLDPSGNFQWTGFDRRGPFRVRAGDAITINPLVVGPVTSSVVRGTVAAPGPAEVELLARLAGGVLFPLSNVRQSTDAGGAFTVEVPEAAGLEWAVRATAVDHSASATSEAFALPAGPLSISLPEPPMVAGDGGTQLLGVKDSLRWTAPPGLSVCRVVGTASRVYVDTGTLAATGDLGSLQAKPGGDTTWGLTCFSGYPTVDALLTPGSRYADAEQGLVPGARSSSVEGRARLTP